MNNIWIVVLLLIAVLIFARVRMRRDTRRPVAPKVGPRVTGSQVVAFVHPRMDAACLFDNGVQFGRGFRRKDGPSLPHDDACGCEIQPFNFTSGEVFDGALRNVGELKSTIPDLVTKDTAKLIDCLKQVEGSSLPEGEAAYIEAVDLGSFPQTRLEALRAFLTERYAYLKE